MLLLTRDQFREKTLERDEYKCVVCKAEAKDVHHIMERKLFSDGGYYLNNAVSLCSHCHLKAEKTDISCNELREYANIKEIILPDDYEENEEYDKWGNILLEGNIRLPGEMFDSEQFQKILGQEKIDKLFPVKIKCKKYPRTPHLTHSPGSTNDDKILKDHRNFEGKYVIGSLKMDGENSNVYTEYFHARSMDSKHHISRSWLKGYITAWQHEIPFGWRFCGENMYAKHSIHYKNLESYFYLFSIWDAKNYCLSWKDTKEYADLLDLVTVPIIYEGIFDIDKIQNIFDTKYSDQEGYVIRIADRFHYNDFSTSVAKWVRKNHVQTSDHWMFDKIIPNELKKD